MTTTDYTFKPEKQRVWASGIAFDSWVLDLPSEPEEAIAAIRFMQDNCDGVGLIPRATESCAWTEIHGTPKNG